MANSLDDLELDLECPNCRRKFKAKGRNARRGVTCPGCKTTIEVDMRDAEKQLDKAVKDGIQKIKNAFR